MISKYNKDDVKRIERINQMIIEMAGGNFKYKIPTTANNDELETITMLLNMMAEELQESYGLPFLPHTQKRIDHLVELCFIIDEKFRIAYISPSAEAYLTPPQKVNKLPFRRLVDKVSKASWKKLEEDLLTKEFNSGIFEFKLKTIKKLGFPAKFIITKMLPVTKADPVILISSLQTVNRAKQEEENLFQRVQAFKEHEGNRSSVLKRESDINTIKEIHSYILAHLDESLVSLKDLANAFGTNEFKLKNGFKELYQTTVFRFQTEERLKKAILLIQFTDMQLKAVAKATGFKSFPHFSKTFKKRYGYNPSALKRQKGK